MGEGRVKYYWKIIKTKWHAIERRWSPWKLMEQLELSRKDMARLECSNNSLAKENAKLGKCCVDAARIEVAREVCKILLKDIRLATAVIMASATVERDYGRDRVYDGYTIYKLGVGPFCSCERISDRLIYGSRIPIEDINKDLSYSLAKFLSQELQEGQGNEETNHVVYRADWRYWNHVQC